MRDLGIAGLIKATALAWALASLGGAVPAIAGEPAAAAPAAIAGDLASRAQALRLFGPGSEAPDAQFSAAEGAATQPFYGAFTDQDRPFFTLFLGLTRQYVLESGDIGISGWWNPYAAVWVIGEWRRDGGGVWRLARLAPLRAEDITTGARPAVIDFGEVPAWAEAEADPLAALLAADAKAVHDFKAVAAAGKIAALLKDQDRIALARALLLTRTAFLQRQVTFVRDLPGYGEIWVKLGQAIDQAADTGLASEVRRSLMPVLALRMKNGLDVVLASPFAPGSAIVVRYAAPGTIGEAAVPLVFERVAFFKADQP